MASPETVLLGCLTHTHLYMDTMIFLMDLQMMLLDVVYFILCSSLRIVRRPHTMPIDGELVLITGSGGALGHLFALEFSKHGAEVVLWDINGETNEETAKLVRAQEGQAHAYTVDVTNRNKCTEQPTRYGRRWEEM